MKEVKEKMVICRFYVCEKAEVMHWEGGRAFRISLAPAKSEPFGSATPQGKIEMLIVPNDAAEQFQIGKFYLVRFDLDPDQSIK
jgi:hypothetical protein